MINFINEIDRDLFFLMNSSGRFPALDLFFVLITNKYFLAVVFVLICISFFVMFKKEFIIHFIFLASGVGLLDFLGAVVKRKLMIPRPSHPEFFLEAGNFLTVMRRSGSFPSNHALNWGFIVFYIVLFLCSKKKYRLLRLFFLSFGLLVSYSRVYVGVHYPSDIAFGFLAGSLTALLFISISNRIENLTIRSSKE